MLGQRLSHPRSVREQVAKGQPVAALQHGRGDWRGSDANRCSYRLGNPWWRAGLDTHQAWHSSNDQYWTAADIILVLFPIMLLSVWTMVQMMQQVSNEVIGSIKERSDAWGAMYLWNALAIWFFL